MQLCYFRCLMDLDRLYGVLNSRFHSILKCMAMSLCALSTLADLRRHMLLDDLYDFLQVVVRVLMIVQSIGELFEGLKEAVQVHLVVITPSDHVLVDNIIMSLQDVAVG